MFLSLLTKIVNLCLEFWKKSYVNHIKNVRIGSFLWSVFLCVQTEYREFTLKYILWTSRPKTMKNGTGKTYLFGYFSRSVSVLFIPYFLSFTNFTDKKNSNNFCFYWNQSAYFLRKSMDWFVYEGNIGQ